MTSKLVVNTIEADTGISSVSFASSISLSSTSVFHFGNAGLNIGGDLNINRPSAGVIGFNINGSEAARINANGFLGDGSQLTGLPAGLGTALSSVQTSPLNKLYYTDRVLSIGSTVTIDHPASASGAYTQYTDIQVEDNADLIVADGDDLIPDIFGIGATGTTGAGGAGRLLVDNIVNRSGTGAPTLPNGAVVTGVCTATSFVGNGAGLTNVSGKVLQIKHAIKTDTQDFGSISQGAETAIPFVASITPSSSGNKILVQMMITMDMNTTHGTFATAKKTTGGTTTEPAIGDAASNRHRITTGTSDNATSTLRNIHILFVDTAGTTNQIDYGFTLSHNDNNPVTIYLNYHGGDSDYSYNGRGVSSIVLTEFEP